MALRSLSVPVVMLSMVRFPSTTSKAARLGKAVIVPPMVRSPLIRVISATLLGISLSSSMSRVAGVGEGMPACVRVMVTLSVPASEAASVRTASLDVMAVFTSYVMVMV